MCVYTCSWMPKESKRLQWVPGMLESRALVSWSMWVLGTRLRASERAAHCLSSPSFALFGMNLGPYHTRQVLHHWVAVPAQGRF